MGRETEIRELPADMPEILPARAVQIEAAQDALAVQAMTAKTLATQLGYDGALTVGALADEIRFYQRRTVEAILETGKRLLLLKELTPHGEFSQRAELLGFHIKTAQRFMKAASKTSKSDKLSFLSTQVKSSSAFLELVTHDDDALEVLADMDGVDRMSASQLRTKVREMEAEKVANDRLVADLHAQKDKLDRKLHRQTVAVTDWPVEFKGFIAQVQHAHKEMKVHIGALDIVREKAMAIEPAFPEEEAALNRAREMLANELLKIHSSCAECLEAMGHTFGKTLGAFATGEA